MDKTRINYLDCYSSLTHFNVKFDHNFYTMAIHVWFHNILTILKYECTCISYAQPMLVQYTTFALDARDSTFDIIVVV